MIDETYKPAQYDTGIVRGDTYSQAFNFRAAGLPLDLTGATPRIQLRKKAGELIDAFALDNGITINTNTLYWTIVNSRTAGYETGKYVFDIEITAGGVTRTYITGTFTVQKDITQE